MVKNGVRLTPEIREQMLKHQQQPQPHTQNKKRKKKFGSLFLGIIVIPMHNTQSHIIFLTNIRE